jgi:hypothetical protein
MDEMMKRPICAPFLADNLQLHSERLVNMTTLESIHRDLLAGCYHDIESWVTQVTSFWRTLQKFTSSHIQIMARDQLDWFSRHSAKVVPGVASPDEWIYGLRRSYDQMLGAIRHSLFPDELSEFNDRLSHPADEPLFLPFRKDESKALIKAIAKIENAETLIGVRAIVEALEAGAKGRSWNNKSGDLVVHINDCSQQTRHTLRSYIQRRFAREGIEYPVASDDDDSSGSG